MLSLKKKILLGAGVGVLALSLGVGFAWLKAKGPWTCPIRQGKALPQVAFATNFTEGETVEVSGKAFCGYCSFGIGKGHPSIVLKTEEGKILPLAINEKFEELEKITGTCANGTVDVAARGKIVIQEGRKRLLLESFSQKKS